MRDWVAAVTASGLTHVMERVREGGVVAYCTGTYYVDSVVERFEPIDTTLTCLWCAAWWTPDFGARRD
jgi:glutamine amidotransferase-like uncharacterized protein